MEQMIITWGYWAIALGCFLEGETVLVLGGMLAHKGYVRLEWVVLAALIGSLAGDQLWFLVGRFASERWLGRLHRLQTASDRLARWTNRHGGWFAFGFRFLYGIRSVAPVFLACHVSRWRASWL
jgi:membrane protein DedA with SNARE-associated domain